VCGLALGSLVRERRWRVGVVTAFTVIGVAIGISRMVLGVHWPSDVLAGWCIGTAVACAVSAALVIPAARADVRRADPGS
jgi:undecaprenyl-diphosphatase